MNLIDATPEQIEAHRKRVTDFVNKVYDSFESDLAPEGVLLPEIMAALFAAGISKVSQADEAYSIYGYVAANSLLQSFRNPGFNEGVEFHTLYTISRLHDVGIFSLEIKDLECECEICELKKAVIEFREQYPIGKTVGVELKADGSTETLLGRDTPTPAVDRSKMN